MLSLARRLASLVLHRCAVCAAPLPLSGPPQDRVPLCRTCKSALDIRPGGFCSGCGELLADQQAVPHLCAECLTTTRPWDSLSFRGPYHGPLAPLILGFKHHGGMQHARLLQELFAEAALHRMDGPLPDILAPVPLHSRRLAWRGFNQSLEIARLLAQRLDRPLDPSALTRTRHTIPQVRLSGTARQQNLRGAFLADPSHVQGRRVLLVDDVMTTGATIRECAAALRDAGAAGVDVAVLARA